MEKIRKFVNELLLYSGQYALFYIIMKFSNEKLSYFKDFGHTMLLLLLVIQTLFLINYGSKFFYRFFGSLIAPFFYTVIEFKIDYEFFYNTAHVFFWIFSILVGLSQAIQIKLKNIKYRKTNEYFITFTNVITFLFLYFYFDLSLELNKLLINNEITNNEYNKYLTVFYLKKNVLEFLNDTAHIYIMIGGLFLAFSIAVGRIKILELNEEIKNIFGRYIDNDIRDKIIKEGHGLSEKKDISILFSDIRNFTVLTEKNSPEEVIKVLNIYFSKWEYFAKKYNGTIDKFIGDAVMIAFEGENSCNNSVNCSKEMLLDLKDLKQEFFERELPTIENIGVGIDYGTVIAGDIGSKNRVNYTFIGDTVNISSRLESLCKPLKKSLIISESVYNNLEDKNDFILNETDTFLKGKEFPIKTFYFK